jgi:anti-sigma factor RsiW
MTRHPENEQILRYADGELPARAARRVRTHLNACWECRAQLQEIEETIGNCVGYRNKVLKSHLPTPPAPWFDIYQKFNEMDASTEPVFFPGAARAASTPARGLAWLITGPRRWAMAAAALLIVCAGIYYRFRQTPSIQAAELLRKAIAAADAQPHQKLKARRIRIRTGKQSVTRMLGPLAPASNAADSDALNSLQAMFVAARYDWQDPLSAKSFQAWRDQLPNKRDEVVSEQDIYRVRTSTDSGELLSASLDLRAGDLQPLEERFDFRNRDSVEITELADETAPETVARDNNRPVEMPAALPASIPPSAASPLPEASATVGDELHVFAALHQVGADLGDPIEVTRNGGKVLVTGVGIAPSRQREIADMLASQPQIVVHFSEAAPSRVKPEREILPAENNPNAEIRQLQSRLAKSVGGRANFDQIAAQVLDLSDNMMTRAYALRRLAETFPSEAEAELNAQDLQLLRTMRQEHAAALRQQAAEIDRLVKPALASVSSVAPAQISAGLATGWQSASQQLFQSARRLEKLLGVVFGAAAVEASSKPEEQLPTQVLYSLAELRARSDAYQRFVTPQPPERRNR